MTIDRAELVRHSSSDGDSYEVEADYHFDFAGGQYRSSAVAVDSMADSSRDRHNRRYKRLSRYLGREGGYKGWVDPEDPTRSLLIREIDWGKVALLGLMGLLFAGVGIGLIIGAAIGAKSVKQEQQRKTEHPQQPWLWKKEWQHGAIRSDDRTRMLGIGIFALLWNGISAPLPFVFWSEWQSGNHAILIAMLFPLIGLILFGAVFAINSAVHSYLILAYSDFDKVSMNVGFYYMANAGGRLTGTVLSGLVYQTQGLTGCLWWSAGFVLAAALLSLKLPEVDAHSETESAANG